MYFKSLEIENVGPIDHIKIEFPKNGTAPKPLIIVGENGTGKSILLSHLVNSLIVGKQEVFDNIEVEKGKVYKYRSADYIKNEKNYAFSSVQFESGIKVEEWQLRRIKSDFEEQLGYSSIRTEWSEIKPNENSNFVSTFSTYPDQNKEFFKKQCNLYFPVNRFEDPAWLNIDNLTAKANYSDLKRISGYSNRDMICTSPLKNNKNWLLDLIFDRQAFEIKTLPFSYRPNADVPVTTLTVFTGYAGQSTDIYSAVLNVLKVVLRESGNVRLGAGTRKNRVISIMKDEKNLVPNLFQLSTGEIQLLNLFLSIVRDYDLSDGEFNNLNDIKGIVIIDEIDSHLHTIHQKEVLPELIASFPNIQFIITTHSPLFLIGMEEKFGSDGFEIIDMPLGEKVVASDFSEFTAAYEAFKETTKYREGIREELERHSKPIVFVEGDYDIRYLTKAAELLGKNDLLERIQLKDGDGFGNLDKIWKAYNNSVSEVIPSKIILLYDCDTNKQDSNKNLVYKRIIPLVTENPIAIGIENLFSNNTIEKVESANYHYIDVHEASVTRIRGNNINKPAYKSVNKDEKGNMCDWLCENGDLEDFSGFQSAFDIIENLIKVPNKV
ncbi:MAG: AAA family ATPase [Sulfuricurvum sp.]|nr:AAA family ATPase [Sulfuricurvum sp.]